MVFWIVAHPVKGSGGIHIPKNDLLILFSLCQYSFFKFLVKYAYTTGFDDNIRIFCRFDASVNFSEVGLIDHHLGVIRIRDVLVRLTTKGIRLIKGDFMSLLVKGFNYSPVVGGRSIPVRTDETTAKK